MLTNFHTHTVFCDGKNTPEEMVKSAIDKGFLAIGFSEHGYTDYDLRYCLKNTVGYINEILRLKEKYKKDIQVYLGVEEDAFCPANRSKFDYIIGSAHYICADNNFLPVDSTFDGFKKCLHIFEGDILRFAESYYSHFCEYINKRKPDIIGHFDLITKFDELEASLFLDNAEYNKIAEKYIVEAAKSDCIFEVNTGAISRGFRTSFYPATNLLYILKKLNARLILSSDSHSADTLDFGFDDAKNLLRDIGFSELFTLYNGEFIKYNI